MIKKIIIGVLLTIVVLSLTVFYQVNEMEEAIVLRFGEPVRVISKAGLYMKSPFIENVERFDKRLLEYNTEPREVIAKDKKNIVIDNYARWRIKDTKKFLQTVHDERNAQLRLDDIIYSELREKLGKYELNEIVANKREEIMKLVTEASNKKTQDFGADVIDVRIKRTELPKENEQHVYERMSTERLQQAKKYRSEGQENSLKIKAEAEKEKTIILAEAYKQSEEIKGLGDAEALRIYAEAYNKDKEFYKFMRTLEAYQKIMNGKGKTNVILSTDSEVWKYFNGKK